MMKTIITIFILMLTSQIFAQDTIPAQLVSFSLSPQMIDVTDGPEQVNFTVGATDDISGVSGITIFIGLPEDESTSTNNGDLISGTIQDGIWELDVSISEYTESGVASISMIWLFDVAGNFDIYDAVELAEFGFDLDFEIVNDNEPDNNPPELTSFDFSPLTIDVTDGPEQIIFTVGASDTISGVSTIIVQLGLPNNGGTSTNSSTIISGTEQNGVWELDVSISEYTDPGIGFVSLIWLFDAAGNSYIYDSSELVNLGYNVEFEIFNDNILDEEAPVLTSFEISPQIVDVTEGPELVTFTVGVTDNQSGVSGISVSIGLPNDGGGSTSNNVMISGTALDGVWELSYEVSEFTPSGTGIVGAIFLLDLAGNLKIYSSSEIEALGFDADFEIINNDALPVIWSKPLKIVDSNRLLWATAQQVNNSHFEVEYSLDGILFQPIEIVIGEGFSNTETNYEYVHQDQVRGRNYYRIKQVDYDGHYGYSNTVSVNVKEAKIDIYPNPATDYIIINALRAHTAEFYSQHGKLLGEYRLVEGQNSIDISKFASGVYFINSKKGRVQRIIKN